ncbi:hypothetical protein KKC13_12970 [bacterium]|nr:hypothetical protein [bacterium]MBU1959545.1 hypothetical protein [bacterium]
MKKSIGIVMGAIIFFIGCSKTEPNVNKNYIPEIEESEQPIQEVNNRKIFSDTHVKRGDIRTLIETLDAFPWEKKALHSVYRHEGKMIWHPNQIQDFRKILQDDSYLAMCGDRRYWNHLEVTGQKAKHDVLYSVLLLKYLNNLSSGCRQWVSSEGMVLNENRTQNIKAEYVLSLLARGALIEKLFISYLPKNREFFVSLNRYKALEKSIKNSSDLKRERLFIEQYKTLKIHPTYD